jgi:N-acetylneuraminic acid mutarotase
MTTAGYLSVNFDKSTYYAGDTVHITGGISTSDPPQQATTTTGSSSLAGGLAVAIAIYNPSGLSVLNSITNPSAAGYDQYAYDYILPSSATSGTYTVIVSYNTPGGGTPLDGRGTFQVAPTTVLPVTSVLPTAREYTSAVWDGTNAYVFGGFDGSTELSDIVAFTPATGAVTELSSSLPSGRAGTSAIWDGNNAYIFGGYQSTGIFLSDIIQFNPATGTVTKLASTLPSGRESTSAIWDGTNAYIFGGDGNGGILSDIIRFTPANGTVKKLTSTLPTGRTVTSAIWDGNNAYIFGGYGSSGGNQATILRFNPTSGAVTELTSALPSGRQGTSAIWDGTNAFIFGGTDGVGHFFSDIIQFTPADGTVKELADTLPTARAGTSAVSGSAYIFGGRELNRYLNDIVRFNPTEVTTSSTQVTTSSTAQTSTTSFTTSGTTSTITSTSATTYTTTSMCSEGFCTSTVTSTVASSQSGSVDGMVYYYDQYGNMHPMSWAQVTAYGAGSSPIVAYATDGSYSMRLPAGTYTITASGPSGPSGPVFFPQSTTVVVSDGHSTSVNFYLKPTGNPIGNLTGNQTSVTPTQTGTTTTLSTSAGMSAIRGRVYWYDQYGDAHLLAGAQVAAVSQAGVTVVTPTDGNGNYALWLATGTYNVTASSDPNYQPHSVVVSVVSGGMTVSVDFYLKPTCTTCTVTTTPSQTTTTGGATVTETSTVTSTTTVSTLVTNATTVGLQMQVVSNSSVSGLIFDSTRGLLNFTVSGPSGTHGFFDATIAKSLLSGQPIVLIDGVQSPASVNQDPNFWYVHVTYPHSQHHVTIGGSNTVPEFPSSLFLVAVLMIATVVIRLRRRVNRAT